MFEPTTLFEEERLEGSSRAVNIGDRVRGLHAAREPIEDRRRRPQVNPNPTLGVLNRRPAPGIPRLARLHDVSPDGRQFLVSVPEAEGPTGLRQRPAD